MAYIIVIQSIIVLAQMRELKLKSEELRWLSHSRVDIDVVSGVHAMCVCVCACVGGRFPGASESVGGEGAGGSCSSCSGTGE